MLPQLQLGQWQQLLAEVAAAAGVATLQRQQQPLAPLPSQDPEELLWLPLQLQGPLYLMRVLKPHRSCRRGRAVRLLRVGASLLSSACSNINPFGHGWH